MTETQNAPHTVAVFADRAPGQAHDWDKLVAEAGALCAQKGWHIVMLSEDKTICGPLLKGALGAGGAVSIVSDGTLDKAQAEGAKIEAIADREARLHHLAQLADGFMALPTSIASARALHGAWVLAGGGSSGKPVAFLNRNRAFEVLRGYAADVLNQSLSNSDRLMVFSETLEDLLGKLQKVLDQQA